MYLFKNDVGSSNEFGFVKNDFSHVCSEFQESLLEQNED